MFNRAWWIVALSGIILSGCGGGSPGSSDESAPPAPIVLTGIQITQGDMTVDVDQSVTLNATGTWSNGSTSPVDASWIASDPGVAILTHPLASSSTDASFLKEGTCDVTATCQSFASTVTLTVAWVIPADPGAAYILGSAGLRKCTMGTSAASSAGTGSFGNGFVLSPAADALYAISGSGAVQGLARIDTATSASTPVATLPTQSMLYFGMDRDSQGRIYTLAGNGAIVRFTPSTGAVDSLGTTSEYQNAMAVGPDGCVYSAPLYSGGPSTIRKWNPATGTSSLWSTMSPEILGSGVFVNAGLVMNRDGEAYFGEMSGDSIYKHVDLNGDGDARDIGETARFATLPCGYGVSTTQVFGLGLAAGGSLLVNCDQTTTTASNGIYWLTDRDGDGTCDGSGEVTLFNPSTANNGLFSTCVQARR